MNPPLRSALRGTLLFVILLIATLLVPDSARAIQLRWSTGATDLSVPANTQAVLVVQADSSEGTLPNTWRLLWTTDSLVVQFSAFDPNSACLVDTAKVDSITPPQSPADSAANQVTAWFCSSGSTNAASACFLADLPGGGHGKLEVVALDPNDSTQVIESDEVTFNGGVEGDYAPTILSATSTHTTSQLQVTVIGTNLSTDAPLTIGAASGIWSVPLTVVGGSTTRALRSSSSSSRERVRRADLGTTVTTLTTAADVQALLPAAVVQSGTSPGGIAIASVLPDELPDDQPGGGAAVDTILFRDPDWNANWSQSVYPKDFAFFINYVPTSNPDQPWRKLFHLIYIRHNNNYDSQYHSGVPGITADTPESLLVHAWSPNLRDWRVDKRAFAPDLVNTNAWDHLHVWAPAIVAFPNITYLFYTGVDALGNQSIGYATTTLLDTSDTQWTNRTQVYRASEAGWADSIGHFTDVPNQVQFRDPCVIPDPDDAAHYLMFVVGEDDSFPQHTVVGVAKNKQLNSFDGWTDHGAYRATDYPHTGVGHDESPLVVRDSTAGAPWRIFVANSGYDSIGSNSTYFISESLGASLLDNSASKWSAPTNLFTYLGSDNSLLGWEACEHVQLGAYHYFAGYNGDGIAITRTRWDPVSRRFKIGLPTTAVGSGVVARGIGFRLLGFKPGVQDARFQLESLEFVTPQLAIYDLQGRRVKTLLDGRRFVGRQEIRWDFCDARGGKAPCGVYFARLTGAGSQQVRRVVVVR